MNPGAEYDSFVTCARCKGRRPPHEVGEFEVEGSGEVGLECLDAGWCQKLKREHQGRLAKFRLALSKRRLKK